MYAHRESQELHEEYQELYRKWLQESEEHRQRGWSYHDWLVQNLDFTEYLIQT
jgi:hypothetical protein